MPVALANARTLGTVTTTPGRPPCAPNQSGAFCAKSGAFVSRGQSIAFRRVVSNQNYTGPTCRSKLSEDDDEVEGAETETKDNPELKLLVDLIVEYPATRGTLAVLFG